MENAIIIVVLGAILGGAVAYIVKAKKSGVKCIGCSAGGSCGMKQGNACNGCNSGCGCGGNGDDVQENCGCHRETK